MALAAPLLTGLLLAQPAAQAAQGDAGPAVRPSKPGLSTRSLLLGGGAPGGDIGPFEIQLSNLSTAFIERLAPSADVGPLFPPGIGGTALVLRLFVVDTGREELFTLFVPSTPPGVSRPLLTCFHGANVSHLDIFFNTTYLQEADARGWFLIAPLQREQNPYGQLNYASADSQFHVEAVIAFVLRFYDIDLDRLYGVGFSMGGGSAMSFAARHRDRATGAFAAVVNHTGSVALSDVYAKQASVQTAMETIFGGTPATAAFEYQRSSVVELDAAGVLLPSGRHMARNLEHVPVRTVYGLGDSLTYLVDQCVQLDSYMQTLPQATHQLFALGVPTICAPQSHCWETLNETAACDFLDAQTLRSAPQAGGYLIDRDDVVWGRFRVEATLQGQFASMEYEADPAANEIRVDQTSNLDTLRFDVRDFGLDPALPLTLRTGTIDLTRDVIELEGFAAAPTMVTIGAGTPVVESCTTPGLTSWCYQGGVLTLNDVGGGAVWNIQ